MQGRNHFGAFNEMHHFGSFLLVDGEPPWYMMTTGNDAGFTATGLNIMTKTTKPQQVVRTSTPTEYRRNYDGQQVEHRSFGVKDRLGRVIGSEARTWTQDVKPTGEPPRTDGRAYHLPAGTLYGFEPHATRDGRAYGACQSDQYYATAEERDRAVALYFVDAEKRALKTAAK